MKLNNWNKVWYDTKYEVWSMKYEIWKTCKNYYKIKLKLKIFINIKYVEKLELERRLRNKGMIEKYYGNKNKSKNKSENKSKNKSNSKSKNKSKKQLYCYILTTT